MAGSGGVNSAGSGGSNAGSTNAGGTNAGGTGGGPISSCPTNPPSGACVSGLACSYGDDLRPLCRTRYDCSNGQWTLTQKACAPVEDCAARDGGIPQVGKACTDVGEDCTLNGGSTTGLIYCRCDSHTNPVSTQWDCVGPPAKPCPQVLPNEGAPCDTDVGTCNYGSCSMGPGFISAVECSNHVWKQVGVACAT
jgi:hypothetical protein